MPANSFNLRVSVMPKSWSLIDEHGVAILIKDRYKLQLLKKGIYNPLRLIAEGSSTHPGRFRGRGPLTTITLEEENGVRLLGKQCMRGGLIRHISTDIFWAGNRPFEEMIANHTILERGIKTSEIIAAVRQQIFGPFYRGYLFSLEIPGCTDLVTYFNGLKGHAPVQRYRAKQHIFEAVAHALSTMHARGIYHGDLHLKNVLIRTGASAGLPEVYLIDFDKAVIKARLSPREKIRNFLRFNRSIEKYRFYGGGITGTDQLKLCRTYLRGNEDLEQLLGEAVKRSRTLLRLRRVAWRIRRPRNEHRQS